MAEKKQINPIWAAAKPFVNGGASGARRPAPLPLPASAARAARRCR